MTDKTTEQLIQEKGLNAPRVTPQDLQDNIVGCFYFTGRDGALRTAPDDYAFASHEQTLSLLTFCVLVLKNGFTVTGESA